MIRKNPDGSVTGTPWELLEEALKQFQKLSPEEQKNALQKTYEEMGAPLPDDASTVKTEGEKGMTAEEAKRILREAPEVEAQHPPLVGTRPKPKD